MANRQQRRNPIHPCLPKIYPDKQSVINNERKKAYTKPKVTFVKNERRDG